MIKKKLQIVKIGGNVINDDALLQMFLKDFSQLEDPKILVHGGGKRASELSSVMGLEPVMIHGRRVTDTATLEVVTMVYAGLLNKSIVAQLQAYNCMALGLTGADANCIRAHKRIVKEIDYGYAGDIDNVNEAVIDNFLKANLTLVFCAITHDKKNQLLNTNADTIASEISIAMSDLYEVELNYIFELKGVLKSMDDKNSVITKIDLKTYGELMEKKLISKGMVPKLLNCFNALKKGVSKIKIGDASLIKNTDNLYSTISL